MTDRYAKILLLVLTLPFSAGSFAQAIVITTDRVVTGVKIRATASTQSQELGKLVPGEQAKYLGEVPGWFRIQHPAHGEGFVSKGWVRVITPTDGPVTSGPTYDVYIVDVGTGLGILVRGDDFALVYDAGSHDDSSGRFLDFLNAVVPTLQTIDHLVISHAHEDHISMLPKLLDAKEIKSIWDSGIPYATCIYQDLLLRIKDEGSKYHTAIHDGGTHQVSLTANCGNQPHSVALAFANRIETNTIPLGQGASMRFLHVDGTERSDLNENSLVVMLNLGGTRILLPGDSGGGVRANPSTPPKPNSVEGALLACCINDLPADILVLGHHGSKTSSRKVFVDAVRARDYVVSSGPKKFGPIIVLPDQVVLDLVQAMPNARLWRTNINDTACKTSTTKIGSPNDGQPGGCSTVHIHIPGSASSYDVSVF
jgi:competence protein ComEC